jgi:threonine synthase
MADGEYVTLVRELDERVARVAGTGFRVTPFSEQPQLSERLGARAPGGVWVKDETGNVSGSHKARHLMGLLVWLEVVERVGLASHADRRLAIASCGNAALAAAVVARAGARPLDVFVPTWADPEILRRFGELGAEVTVCPRQDGVAGDPTYHRLREAVAAGSIPFTCQGGDNGLTIEGGLTIGYEMAEELRRAGAGLDRVTVQVGGGALASAVIQGLSEAHRLGALDRVPVIDTVQTEGAHPLQRAYDLVLERIVPRLETETGRTPATRSRTDAATLVHELEPEGGGVVADELSRAARHRSGFMWPWEEEPKSVAHGIIDDETYDWVAVVGGMLSTGGVPRVVGEDVLVEANDLARATTSIDVDETGSAGLAGLLETRRAGEGPATERAAVLFTGARR